MTATQTILTALRSSGLPVEAQACLAAIAEGQGTVDFFTLYSGGTLVNPADSASIQIVNGLREWTGPLSAFPTWHGATTDTAVYDYSTASGAWQDTGTTFRAYAPSFGIADFEPPSQISFNWQLAQKVFGTRMGSNLLQFLQAGEISAAYTYLVSTWPAGPGFDFPTSYSANLAVLQTPVPPPPPAADTYELTLTAEDGTTQTGTLTLHKAASVASKAAAVLLVAGMLGSSVPMPHALAYPPAMQQVGGPVALPPSFCGGS